MKSRLDRLLKNHPVVYHVTYTSNVPKIEMHGFYSANALKQLAASSGGFRDESVPLACGELGKVMLRDQGPMAPNSLEGCCEIPLHEWYELVDDHIFFFFDYSNAEKIFEKYTKRDPQSILELPTREVLLAAGSAANLTPINTGAVGRARAKRGVKTFHALDSWISEGFTGRPRKKPKAPVELAIRLDHLRAGCVIRAVARND
jgi:hypothetical protein